MILKLIALAYVWFVLPILLGNVWSILGRKEHTKVVWKYLLGTVTMWAVFCPVGRYAVEQEMLLSELGRMWMIVIVVLSAGSVIFLVKKKVLRRDILRIDMKKIVLFCIAWGLLAGVALLSVNEREDYTVESVLTMFTTDTLYEYSPMSGKAKDDLLTFEAEELEKQSETPIDAYYASYVAMTKIYPAKFVRILLPILLLPFYLCVYNAWGNYLFPRKQEKRYLFQIVVWALYGTTLIADKSLMFGIFGNCWNGETLFFLGVLPLAVLLLLGDGKEILQLEDFRKPDVISKYLLCALAGQLLDEKGFFLVTFIWAVAFVAVCIKRWKDGDSITTVAE